MRKPAACRQVGMNTETEAALKAAESKLRRARSNYERARQARNEAVRQAVAEGVRPTDIARVTGLTRGRIRQIETGET